jgi:hypothetical protein
MGKLTRLLKTVPKKSLRDETNVVVLEEKKKTKVVKISPKTPVIEFDISDEELQKVKDSVEEIDTSGKNRRQIIIGMFGAIKNPRTGKRFVIPGVDYQSENYIYRYAEMMRTLVNRPEDFKKIMNWG